MKKLIVIVLFVGVFTQSSLAGYYGSALEDHCEQGIVNGKYQGGAYNPKVCLRAIKAVANDKSIRQPHKRYARAKKIAGKVCRKYGQLQKDRFDIAPTQGGRKACQLQKYYQSKYNNSPSRYDRPRW